MPIQPLMGIYFPQRGLSVRTVLDSRLPIFRMAPLTSRLSFQGGLENALNCLEIDAMLKVIGCGVVALTRGSCR